MPLSWNEIRDRSVAFSKEWKDEASEDAEAKTFWDNFFKVFGITRRRVASFEEPVKKSDGKGGFIDLLWKGVLVVEHKSLGKDLTRAFHQATDYFSGLKERDLPRYVLVSDFARFRLHDLDEGTEHEFPLKELHKNVRLFGFIAGYETRSFGEQDPVNIAAAEKLGKLHDQLKAVGYDGHALEVFLVRLLFCLFAEDNAIFERQQFRELVELRSAEDGSDLAALLANLFQVLNTTPEKRLKNLDEQIAAFAYINGKLFAENLPVAAFDKKMRETLLDCMALVWARISPAIFGALFQSIMNKKARRNLGAHYTSEGNILKALRPLFLDALRAEFERVKRDKKRLVEFHNKLGRIRILDPACGCGNFLVIAYRELRLLELEVLRELYKAGQMALDVSQLMFVDVDQFYGIEIEEFPAQIAQVALWMTDHQMNLRVSEEFGQYFARLPLKKSPNVVHGNALAIDWRTVVAPADLSYIVGNPPFVGKHYRSPEQRDELVATFSGIKAAADLDYVAAWYMKAAQYIEGTTIRCALVATNSICQGEQVPVLWPALFGRGMKIHFAHRTFQWSSEARGAAAVHCIIVGFGLEAVSPCRLFSYDQVRGEAHEEQVPAINAYLTPGPMVIVDKATRPISSRPTMRCGNKPSDGGHLLLLPDERDALIKAAPGAAKFVRRFVGCDEYLYSLDRYCLWLEDASPAQLKALPLVMARVEAVRKMRLESTAAPTQKAAAYPTRFFFESQPNTSYVLVPEVSSEKRLYVPIGLMPAEIISSNKNYLIGEPNLYVFGLLQSIMHMAWMRTVGGRLESRYQYSATMVYNTFPWPKATDKQHEAIERATQSVLDVRDQYPDSTPAELYDPLSMPPELVKAHQKLDKAVDAAYGKTGFNNEAERVAFLFELYRQVTAPLDVAAEKPKRKSRSTSAQSG